MPHRLPIPENLTGIRGRILVYIVQAPHFTGLRRATTYDFTADDVLKTIEEGLQASAAKVAAKAPRDADRPARWISQVREARRLVREGDVQGSVDCMAALQREYYAGPSQAGGAAA